jgi:hypothetical protein
VQSGVVRARRARARQGRLLQDPQRPGSGVQLREARCLRAIKQDLAVSHGACRARAIFIFIFDSSFVCIVVLSLVLFFRCSATSTGSSTTPTAANQHCARTHVRATSTDGATAGSLREKLALLAGAPRWRSSPAILAGASRRRSSLAYRRARQRHLSIFTPFQDPRVADSLAAHSGARQSEGRSARTAPTHASALML